MDQANTQIVKCPSCGTANRVHAGRSGSDARCGKCHTILPVPEHKADAGQSYKLRCVECGARNRITADKVDAGPKCGKCGAELKTDALFVPQPVMVSDANFDAQVLKSPLPVLLFAWAPWCSTCRAVMPVIDEFAAEAKTKVRVGKMNVDQSPKLASEFNILSVPFIFVFDNGQMKESMPGAIKKHDIMMKMAHYL